MSKAYDAIIIGAGQAGPSLAVGLANAGWKVAIVERDKFGGTCVNTGCIPTKTLIASAHVAHMVQHGAAFGVITTGNVTVDMKKVKDRKDAIVKKSNEGLQQWLENTKNCDVYRGHATFKDKKTITVKSEILSADKIFINVGARAFVPPIDGIDQINYLTNSSILDIDYLPKHLIVIGGSYIGLEFAQMYRRFGSKVSVIEQAPRLIAKEDEEVSKAVQVILEQEDIDIHLNAKCIAAEKSNHGVVVRLDCYDNAPTVTGSDLLFAVGRVPNTGDLGLENAGVLMNERGFIQVDDQLQTNVSGIWALGECNGQGAFTHTAYNDYEIVIDHLLRDSNKKISDRIQAYALYIDPPLGRAGLSEAQAREKGIAIKVGQLPMTRVKRAVIKGQTQGFIKIIVDAKTDKIIGANVLGVEGDEVIHAILDVMYSDKPYTLLKNAVHIHPTISELLPTAVSDLVSFD